MHPPLPRISTTQDGRASSAPPVQNPAQARPIVDTPARPGSGTISPVLSQKENILAKHLDIMPALQRSIPSVVKSRNGSVLSRGFILKTDHYPSGELRVPPRMNARRDIDKSPLTL